ncbi:MAG: GAF domain-containing protein [Anaerolineales bacterium]|nr:GAF domain-containing protein [Anaerolineales bacterium]
MFLFSQITTLFTESPGSLLFHLVTLFALQIVFGLSFARQRRNPSDSLALRMAWAAGGIFGVHLLMLIIGLAMNGDAERAATILPPLETAVAISTAALITWALIPRWARYPHLIDIILLITLFATGILTIYFTAAWQTLFAVEITAYPATIQAQIGSWISIAICAFGTIYLFVTKPHQMQPRALILIVLLVAALLQMWSATNTVNFTSHILFWQRLGYMVAFALWAVFAYEHVMEPLRETAVAHATVISRFAHAFEDAADSVRAMNPQANMNRNLNLVTDLFDASFVAIGMFDQHGRTLRFISNIPTQDNEDVRRWKIHLSEWAGFRLAANQMELVEWQPDGLAADQLQAFYSKLNLDSYGSLLIVPLLTKGQQIGMLLVGGKKTRREWLIAEKQLLTSVADFVAQSIANSHQQAARPSQKSNGNDKVIKLQLAQLRTLEAERDGLAADLAAAELRIRQANEQTERLRRRARDVAQTLATAKAKQASNGHNGHSKELG